MFFYVIFSSSKAITDKRYEDGLAMPAVFVIDEIIIKRKEIEYKLTSFVKIGNGIEKGKQVYSEKELDRDLGQNRQEFIAGLIDKVNQKFDDLTKQYNKEKLQGVLGVEN
jgi:hypothetical protein